MKNVRIGNVCKVVSGSTPRRNKPEFWGGDIPWITPKELSDLETPYIEDSLEKITELGYHSCSTKMLPPRSVLLSSRAPIGLLAINNKSVCTNQGFKSLVPSSVVYTEYLYYYLKENVEKLQAKGRGATIKELTKTGVEEFEIPLLPLEDQKRISHLLGKVEGLIARRKQHLQQLDDLLKSVFLEMFGDPVRNKKGWEKKPLSSMCDFENGDRSSRYPSGNDLQDTGVLFLSSREITNFRLALSSSLYISEEKFDSLSRGKCYLGDVLMVLRGAGLGKCCVFNGNHEKAFINAQMIILRCDDNLNNLFLVEQIKNERMFRELLKIGSGSAQPQLTGAKLKDFRVIAPPIDHQNQLANIVEKVESIRSRYQQSLTDLESLYGALSQKAFKDELNLSRVPLQVETTTGEDDPEKHEIQKKGKPFELPEPADLAVMHSAEGRKALLDQWLSAWLEQIGDEPFAAELFMETARQRLWELAEDETPDWAIAEYDELKAWVFEALEHGRLTQGYNDTNNRVQLKMTKS